MVASGAESVIYLTVSGESKVSESQWSEISAVVVFILGANILQRFKPNNAFNMNNTSRKAQLVSLNGSIFDSK